MNRPAADFALPVYYLANNRDRGEPQDGLTRMTVNSALRSASHDPEFIAQLETARSPFWIAVRDALVASDKELRVTV